MENFTQLSKYMEKKSFSINQMRPKFLKNILMITNLSKRSNLKDKKNLEKNFQNSGKETTSEINPYESFLPYFLLGMN